MAQLQNSTINGNVLYHSGNYNRVIDRGNPGSGNPLSLTSLYETHYYYGSGLSDIQLSTTMVENSVYEIHYVTSNSSPSNIDVFLQPNYTAYAGQFLQTYWASMPTATPSFHPFIGQTTNHFYFDHQNGSAGNSPCGTYTIFNHRAKKQVLYRGGDTNSVCYGTGRWNNSTTQWTNVGTLSGLQSATDLKVYVRRIG
jgi:hypothetical protein